MTLVSARARAQSPLELAWSAPSECPQEADVRERLQALVGKPTPARRHLSATGHIERVGKRYRLILSVREGDEVRERTVNADSCNDLAGAAAVALGLLIRNDHGAADNEDNASGTKGDARGSTGESTSQSDADGAREASGTTPEHAPNAATAGAATSKPTPEKKENAEGQDEKAPPGIATSDAGAEGERRWRILLRAPVGIVSIGRLPKPSGGLGAALGASYDAWRVLLGGRVFAAQTLAADNPYEAGARVGRRDVQLDVCRDWRQGRLGFAPCLIGAVQRERAEGSGPGVTPQSKSTTSFVIAGAAEAHLFVFDWAALVASVTLGIQTSRPILQVTTVGDVKKLGPFDLSLSVGPEWIF